MGFPPLDEPTRARLSGRFGPAVAEWLDALPAQVAALATDWGVALGSPPAIDGGRTSVVVHGRATDGMAVVLKLTPEPALAAAEGNALAAASAGDEAAGGGAEGGGAADSGAARGSGADGCTAHGGGPPLPRLLARDDHAGALLIEAIAPGTPLDERHDPPDPVAVGTLLSGLRAVSIRERLPPLRERVAWCFELFERRDGVADDRAALGRGHALALRLADGWAEVPAFVHGDLHPGNVLDGGPARGLVAIDPRACAGDPGFDAVDPILWGATTVADVERRIAAVAAATGYEASRLATWCSALAAMNAVSLAARAGDVPRRAERLATLRALAD